MANNIDKALAHVNALISSAKAKDSKAPKKKKKVVKKKAKKKVVKKKAKTSGSAPLARVPQKEAMDKARQHIADRDKVFLELMRSDNPLTGAEIEFLASKFPERWGRYRKFAKDASETPTSAAISARIAHERKLVAAGRPNLAALSKLLRRGVVDVAVIVGAVQEALIMKRVNPKVAEKLSNAIGEALGLGDEAIDVAA